MVNTHTIHGNLRNGKHILYPKKSDTPFSEKLILILKLGRSWHATRPTHHCLYGEAASSTQLGAVFFLPPCIPLAPSAAALQCPGTHRCWFDPEIVGMEHMDMGSLKIWELIIASNLGITINTSHGLWCTLDEMNSGARRLGSRNLKSNPMKLTALSLFDCDYLLLSIDSVHYTKGCFSGKNRPFHSFPLRKLPTSSTQ